MAGQDEGKPSPHWWTTSYQRALADFSWLSSPQKAAKFFADHETMGGLVAQRVTLMRRMDLLILASFVGAAVLLSGGLPSGATINILGIEGPASLLTNSLISLLVAGAFLRALPLFASLTVLGMMIRQLLEDATLGGTEFVTARWDASDLFWNITRLRDGAYKTPRFMKVNGVLVSVSGLIIVFGYIGTILYALGVTSLASIRASGFLSFSGLASSAAFCTAAIMSFVFFLTCFIPIKHKWVGDDSADQIELPLEQGKHP